MSSSAASIAGTPVSKVAVASQAVPHKAPRRVSVSLTRLGAYT